MSAGTGMGMGTKWCRFQVNDTNETEGTVAYGRIDGDSVTAIDGEPWGAHTVTAAKYPLTSVRLIT